LWSKTSENELLQDQLKKIANGEDNLYRWPLLTKGYTWLQLNYSRLRLDQIRLQLDQLLIRP
jgi:hypothetical protein